MGLFERLGCSSVVAGRVGRILAPRPFVRSDPAVWPPETLAAGRRAGEIFRRTSAKKRQRRIAGRPRGSGPRRGALGRLAALGVTQLLQFGERLVELVSAL